MIRNATVNIVRLIMVKREVWSRLGSERRNYTAVRILYAVHCIAVMWERKRVNEGVD